jgi:hypothetical protein
MSDASSSPARPVSLITTLFILALFAAFIWFARKFYVPTSTGAHNAMAENLNKDLEWRATNESRRAALRELQEKQAKQATSYGWVDQKAGVVQLPIDRAMDLTAQKYGKK